jgi:spore germination protein GerM
LPGEPNKREVLLFFQLVDEDALGPESRRILLTDSVIDQAKQIVSELIAGPRQEGLLPTVPDRTTLREVFLDRSGTLYLDLSEEFSDLHPGGSDDEVATIFSIVDSLTYNLPEIKRVRFLIDGEERDTLKDHLDLRRAYLKDMSIVRLPGAK